MAGTTEYGTMHPAPLTDTGRGGWIAGHIFFPGMIFGGPGDRVALEVVEPFARACRARGWIDRFFFIRYGELGPHVRLRMHGRPEVLEGEVRPALESHVAAALPAELAGAPDEIPEGAVPGAPSLLWIRYEPEVERYGGVEGVRCAEELFFHSSELSLALLPGVVAGSRSQRLGRGAFAMLALLAAFATDDAEAAALAALHRDVFAGPPGARDALQAAAFARGGDAKAAALRAAALPLWSTLRAGAPVPPPLDAYHAAAAALRDRVAELAVLGLLHPEGRHARDLPSAARALVPSYLHMTSNRLGIAPIEEAYLAHLIAAMLA